jgi:peptidoglycan/LPS O-acetylase OafA/YrhL/uncharacterized membrane protein YphA (DoxX/SURF4 family)
MERIASVNGLRGLAIIGIIFSQLTHHMILFGPFVPPPSIPVALVSNIWTGVDLLCILSGFVLFSPYAEGRRTLTDGDALWRFYRHRFVRLIPLFYSAVVVDLIVTPKSWAQTLWLLSGVFDFYPSSMQNLMNWPLWMVGIVIVFSIVFPALVWAWRRVGPWRLVLPVMSVALLARIIGYSGDRDNFILMLWGHEWGSHNATSAIIVHLDEFVLGMLIAHMRAAGAIGRSTAILLGPGLMMTLAAWITMSDLGAVQGNWQPVLTGVAITVLALGYALIVAAALVEGGIFARLLSWRPLQAVGMMSYSLFIWHVPLLKLLTPGRSGNIAFLEGSLLYLIVLFIVATLSFMLIEFPWPSGWRSLFMLTRAGASNAGRRAPGDRSIGSVLSRISPVQGPMINPRTEQYFLFVFRMLAAWLFLSASLSQIGNPRFLTTHVIPVLTAPGVFHDLFKILASPPHAAAISFLVTYGHFLIGLSLLVGLMVRISASFGILLLILYWLVGLENPGVEVLNNSSVMALAASAVRFVRYILDHLEDLHILYCLVLLYLIAGRAGQVWGLGAWAMKSPLLSQRRRLQVLLT